MSDHICYVYSTQYDPPRVALMAWVHEAGQPDPYFAEIHDADGATRTAWVTVRGHLYCHLVPFSALQSVALYEDSRVLQAFGRPAAAIPEWVQYQEVA